MSLFTFVIRTSWLIVLLAILASLVSGLGTVSILILITRALMREQPSLGTLAWSFPLLCVLVLLSRLASRVLLSRISLQAIFELRMRLVRQILIVSLRDLEEIGPSRLLATLTDDVSAVAAALPGIPILCAHATIVVGCLVYLGWLSVTGLLGSLGVMVVGISTYRALVVKALDSFRLAREKQDVLLNDFRALIEGVKELKLHARRRAAFVSQRLSSTALSLQHYNFIGAILYAAAPSWGQFLFFVTIGIVLFALPAVTDLTPRAFTGYSLTILYVMTPLEVIMTWSMTMGRARVALDRVQAMGLSLEARAMEWGSSPEPNLNPLWERINLCGVTHRYQSEGEHSDFLLGPINLTLRPGELVFLIGGNGSGKTTLAKLLTGLYVPETGDIRMDGTLITDGNREWYRQHFSVVFSDFYLFESVASADTPALRVQARDYLRRFQLDHKVSIQDGSFSNTATLSRGQRKRLALIAAYLEDRPIYVFDEWAADQDPFFKDMFYTELLQSLKARGKAVLVITHDERYYEVADRIMKLDNGKLEYDRRAAA